MGTASAEPEKLATFVAAADALLNEGDGGTLGLNRRISALRASYDDFQATDSLPVRNVDLMGMSAGAGGEVKRYAANLERDRLFVEAVRRAFVEAGGSSTGLVSVDQAAFDRALAAAVDEVAREHDINPADLLILRDEITVDDPFVAGVPQSSGFVNDPICTASGHFVEVEEDFAWPERLAVLRWRRVYSSRFVADGPFGQGWASWAGVGCARRPDGSVGFQGPDGQFAMFAPDPSGPGYGRAAGVSATLARLPEVAPDGDGEASGGWELAWDWRSPWPGQRWRFGASGRIEQVTGTAWGTTTFRYDGDHLVALVHDGGRRLDLDWDGERIVAVRSSCGRTARYHYDDAGDLVRTERVTGDRRYVVDDRGRVVEVHDADGVRLCCNTYDDEGRVVAQVSPFGRETRLAYHPGYRTVVSDTADGPVTVYEHDPAGRLTGLLDADGHRMTLTFDAEGRCVAATGFDGATVRNELDGDEGSASHIGADRLAERWDYDDRRRVTSHQVDGGPTVTFDYDGDGDVPVRMSGPDGWQLHLDVGGGLLRSLTDADGVSVHVDHDADGNVVAVRNGLGAETRIEPHVSGEAARLTTADGSTFELERDGAGRLLAVRTPLGDEYRMERSPAGRLRAMVEPGGARTVFDVAAHGEVERIVDALGGAVEVQRDQWARVVGVAAPGGAKWQFDYTALGLLSMVTDPAGGVWQRGYDAEGRVVSATDPAGRTARQRYNPAGRLVEVVDRAGNPTRFGYDAAGRVVREDGPEGAVTTCEWDGWGRPVAVTSPDGGTVRYRYTPGGRVAGVETGDGRSWTNEYDAAGRLVAATDATGATTRYEWDVCDRLVAEISPTGRHRRWRHDALGRVVEHEQAGRVWRTAYDHAGRVVAATDPGGATVRYSYDARGKLVAATDALGNTVRIRYDERGNPTGVVDPLGGLVTTTYDAMRRPLAVTDQLGRTTRVRRDAAGRVVRQELPTGDVVEWRRDARGATTDVRVNGVDVVVFDRDRAGRPVLIHEPARNRTFTCEWTPGGRLRSLDVDGQVMRWRHDGAGRVTARHEPGGRTTRYERDGRGRLAAVAVDGGPALDLERDGDGLLVALRGPGIECRWDRDAGGLVVASHVVGSAGAEATAFTHDAAGRVIEARTVATAIRYRYDAGGRLVGASRDGGEAWLWHYDPAGRLVMEDGPDGTRRFAYDEGHQLVHVDGPAGRTTYGYDAAGRRTDEDGPAGARRYTWDGQGRLAAVESGGRRRLLDVDALGRLAGVDGLPLLWDPTTDVSELLAIGDRRVVGGGTPVRGTEEPGDGVDGAGRGDGRGGSVARVDGSGEGSDGAGGPVTWLAGAGPAPAVALGSDRDVWGARRGPVSAAGEGPSLGWSGEVEVDGLVWLRARVYDPVTRQFLSPDPVPGVPGTAVAAHPYHYADDDPVGRFDPLGMQGEPLTLEQYNEYREQAYGWQTENLVTVGLVAAGVAMMFVPGIGLGGMVLIGAALGAAGGAAPGVIQGFQTGEWDWGAIGGGALKGAVIGGVGAFGGGALGLATRAGGPLAGALTGATRAGTAARGAVAGGGLGFGTGLVSEAYDLTPLPGSDGQFDPEGVVLSTVLGGGTGGAGGALTYRPPPPPPNRVIVDTNAVFNRPGVQANLQPGEVPVVTQTTRAELSNLAARPNNPRKIPRYAGELDTIPDVMDVNTRIDIRGQLAEISPTQRGMFGDGTIGATAVNTGYPVITADKKFATVLESMGVEVRRP